MDEQQTYVIVDPSGHEHEFPIGMDRKRAIQVVKNQLLKAENAKPLKEETSYWPGFFKDLNSQAAEMADGMAQGMSHPQTAGDFLSLLMPTVGGGMAPKTSGELNMVERFAKSPMAGDMKRAAAGAAADSLDIIPASKLIRPPMLDRASKALRKVSNNRPAMLANTDLTEELNALTEHEPEPSWLDRYKPNTGADPVKGVPFDDVAHGSPSTIAEDAGIDSRINNLPPEADGAAEASSSGNSTRYDELLDKLGGRGAAEDTPLGPDSAPESGGGSASAPPATIDLETYLNSLVEHDPGAMAGKAQDLRARMGSRDAAREMFGHSGAQTQGWVKQMAPGPSRPPSEAEERIAEALRRVLMEGEGK